jgi:hypothetical protein
MADNSSLPPEINFDKLFPKESNFETAGKLRRNGFDVIRDGTSNERVTVFGHPSAPNYLFKKFLDNVSYSQEKQFGSYERRVRGARALKVHLERFAISGIIVPRKWLCDLPSRFNVDKKPSQIVVVEKYNLLDHAKAKQLYRDISNDTLKDLCSIFFTFKRVDFSTRNMPFTTEGKIAFIDTGYMSRITEDLAFRRDNYKKNIDKLLEERQQRFAASLWDEFVERRDLLDDASRQLG